MASVICLLIKIQIISAKETEYQQGVHGDFLSSSSCSAFHMLHFQFLLASKWGNWDWNRNLDLQILQQTLKYIWNIKIVTVDRIK